MGAYAISCSFIYVTLITSYSLLPFDMLRDRARGTSAILSLPTSPLLLKIDFFINRKEIKETQRLLWALCG
jgi:hypothetical protein